MSYHSLGELLHSVVIDLNRLHKFEPGQGEEFKALLNLTLTNIRKVLRYSTRNVKRINLGTRITNTEIGKLSIICYSRQSDEPGVESLIHGELLQNTSQNEGSVGHERPVLENLMEVLSSYNEDYNTEQINEASSTIMIKITDLLQFFVNLRADCEKKIANYVARSLSKEFSLVSDSPENLTKYLPLAIKSDEMERLVDKLLSKRQERVDDGDLNELKVYLNTQEPHKADSDVKSADSDTFKYFYCDESDFLRLYRFFFGLLATKQASHYEGRAEDSIRLYSSLLISIYKSWKDVEAFEIDDFYYNEKKIRYICQFFLENEDPTKALLPIIYQGDAGEVISDFNFLPPSKSSGSTISPKKATDFSSKDRIHQQRGSFNQITSSLSEIAPHDSAIKTFKQYSSLERNRILNDLCLIIPILNEFNLNFDLRFPVRFIKYINFFDEKFCMTVSKDIEFLTATFHLIENISRFERQDSDIEEKNIRETVIQFHEAHMLLHDSIISQKQPDFTLLMKFTVFCDKQDISIMYRIIRDWNSKTLEIAQLNYNLSNILVPSRNKMRQSSFINIWHEKMTKIKNINILTTSYYDKSLLMKTFIASWKHKRETYLNKYEIFLKSKKKSFLVKWKNTINSHIQFASGAEKYRSFSLMKFGFKILLNNWLYVKHLEESSEVARKELLRKRNKLLIPYILSKWMYQLDLNVFKSSEFLDANISEKSLDIEELSKSLFSGKLRTLQNIETKLIQKKYFRLIFSVYSDHCKINHACSQFEFYKLRFFFKEQWQRKSKLSSLVREFLQKRDSNLIPTLFYRWKQNFNDQQISKNFCQVNLVKKYFKIFLLNYMLTNRSTTSSNEIEASRDLLFRYFMYWVLKHNCYIALKRRNALSLSIHLNLWSLKYENTSILYQRADIFNSVHSQRQNFLLWRTSWHHLGKLSMQAEFHFKKKFFGKLRDNYHLQERNRKSAATFLKRNILTSKHNYRHLSDIILVKCILRIWLARAEGSIEHNLNVFYSSNLKQIFDTKILSNVLEKWVKKYNFYRMRELELRNKMTLTSYDRNLEEYLLRRWVDKTNSIFHLSNDAIEFERQLLLKKFLTIWFSQNLNLIERKQIADSQLVQNEFSLAKDIISHWSMKSMKITRNKQSCEIFMKRWQASKLRSMFELWSFKATEKNLINKETTLDDEDVSNLSFRSPLLNKTSILGSFHGDSSSPTRSYLYTPLKAHNPLLPATPTEASKELKTSPTKLYQTTQRIKNERIDALRKHFSKAKSTSTPTKKNLIFEDKSQHSIYMNEGSSKFIRLSPPKQRPFNTVLPPDPPNFYSAYAAEMPSISSYAKDDSLSVLNDERSVIESAKRLKKITPIYFPTDELSDPVLSPVSRLKERHAHSYS